MNIFSVIMIGIPAIALVVVAFMLIQALATNVKTGRQVRQKLAEQISRLRYGGMLQREGVNEHVLLHQIPLTEIKEEMAHCESCQHTNTCDQVLKDESRAANDVSFCPNIDAIRNHKHAL